MERNGIWGETAQKAGQYWRARMQMAAAEYPVLFVLAWALKWLVWDVPVFLVRLIASTVKARRAKPEGI